MKKIIPEFLKRGLLAASGGPVVLAIVYGILGATGVVTHFTPAEVAMGILTVTLMAFIAAGITAIYGMERLPLPTAILIHAGVLYLDYLLIYLLNGWLRQQLVPILVFTVIFFGGFALIWFIIYLCIKTNTESINRKLREEKP